MRLLATESFNKLSTISQLRAHFSKKWGLRAISIAAFLIAWEHFGSEMFLIATPSDTVITIFDQLFIDPALTFAVLEALKHGAAGFTLAVVFGIPIGFLIGFWKPARDVLHPIVDALYVTPLVAFVPLFIIWFGLNVTAKIVLVTLLAIFVIIINTEAGVQETPEGLVDAARVFGASDREIYTEVHLKHSLPFILTGVRMGGGRAVRGMVVAELFVFAGPLGNYLVDSGAQFNVPQLFAAIFVLSILGVVVLKLIESIENHLLSYRTT